MLISFEEFGREVKDFYLEANLIRSVHWKEERAVIAVEYDNLGAFGGKSEFLWSVAVEDDDSASAFVYKLVSAINAAKT